MNNATTFIEWGPYDPNHIPDKMYRDDI